MKGGRNEYKRIWIYEKLDRIWEEYLWAEIHMVETIKARVFDQFWEYVDYASCLEDLIKEFSADEHAEFIQKRFRDVCMKVFGENYARSADELLKEYGRVSRIFS
ncbi:hypothetical protein DRJ19_05095 [Candidatus Woesearchaeota archaeon]|nr:MAG: hypothetical protein DRJ19_05095 [Candidatus Woesearchaeota archaeon]